ncbi:hypothetical protein [Syntrophomonas wolfei]|uniref:hypothetical protein n=1 Tax=Syntrophomonas wolfei TaxID=863 RepID=UPI0023F4000F|nr:hypothetical protein [Syntrophomonas wolfei]
MGTGSIPDYAYVKKNPFDVAADSDKFSIAFVFPEAFEELLESDVEQELCYSYRLNGHITDNRLKDLIAEMDIDEAMVQNCYMSEIIDEVEGKAG